MIACLLDLPACVFDQFVNWAGSWPFWVVVAAALLVLGFAYKIAGWPGVLVVLTAGAYFLGKRQGKEEAEPDFETGDEVRPRPPSTPGEPLFPKLRNWLDRIRPRR